MQTSQAAARRREGVCGNTWSALSAAGTGPIRCKSPRAILELFGPQLSHRQKLELAAMKQIWFFTLDKVGKPRGGNNNDGYDDDNNNYIPEEPQRRREKRERRADLPEASEGVHRGHPRLPAVRQGAGRRPRGHQAAQTVGGTLPYMAPELLLGYRVTCAVDMWALGCTVAELATGKVLFNSQTYKDHLHRCIEMLGMPPKKMVDEAPYRKNYFGELKGSGRLTLAM
ncbi:uncharacterized protein LOC116938413 [Petromyzon marinus]|uniref:uncharacterized protein LOC116938413 n=1 Tax=Petromyzon marinus TaxID=7757 RepID=UPI003F6FBD6E